MLTIRQDLLHNRLTTAERVYLFRRRKDWTQGEAAKANGFKVGEWRAFETGHPKAPHPPRTIIMKGAPTKYELMALWRRRHNLSIEECALEMGTTHVTLNKRERGIGEWRESFNWWVGHATGQAGARRAAEQHA